MASIYPTLEDLCAGKMIEAESRTRFGQNAQQASIPFSPGMSMAPPVLYPSLNATSNQQPHNQVAVNGSASVFPLASSAQLWLQAPITGSSQGMMKAKVHHGIRQVTFYKDAQGKAGLRLQSIDNGIFVSFVTANSPASLNGIRFGDQVLQLEQANCAGWSSDQAMAALKASKTGLPINIALRDRPFERTITMLKDSANRAGFGFKDGKIEKIVQDSSAARNGILTEHQLLEVNGQNVVGLSDKEVAEILDNCARDVTITIMPSKIFQQLIKGISTKLIRQSMDHAAVF